MIDLKRLMFDMSLSQREMAQIIGTAQSEISHFANGRRDLKGQYLQSLIAHFGQEVIDKYTLPADAYEPKSRVATVTIINPEIIEEAKELGREEVRGGDVTLSVPFVGKDIATAPDINIRQLIERNDSTLELFPFYKMVKGVDYIQTVITMAMAPRYLPGDYLFIRFRDGNILSGKLYLVDTRPYGTMLRQVHIKEGGYLLKATNPDFKEVFVKTEDVYSISSVVLTVNTNTSLTSEVNLAEMVKNRDQQIAQLTTSNEQLVATQDRCLSEIVKQNERIEKLVRKIIDKE